MRTDWGEVKIIRREPIRVQMVRGVVVGRGLAVTQFPLTDSTGETAYGLTILHSGRLLQQFVYFSWRLAVRCAEELVRLASFEDPQDRDLLEVLGPIWRAQLRPICEKYTRLDDLWEKRRGCLARRAYQPVIPFTLGDAAPDSAQISHQERN